MKALLIGSLLSLFAVVPATAETVDISEMLKPSGTVYHGGGCRKSSPPGQCCHRQSSTGTVHCH
ncbi:MAG TPA: hypothetical protein ENH72_14855 [Pseudomonas sabulinigri]|nr:hypothetical protein [Halopseudomonas sabulinigri]HEC50772.1 hypothetical protein [Halopseudomonas sabulinigri]